MAKATSHERLYNFGAGPGALPLSVLQEVQKSSLNWNNTGMSIMEVSHRSKEFENLVEKAEKDLRTLLSIPSNYKVFWMQGGGTGQFAAVPLNLLRNHDSADYLVSGVWTQKAVQEAEKYCKPHVLASSESTKFTHLPPLEHLKHSPDAAYLYYCANETINGVEYQAVPDAPAGRPLVCDMSSNILSRPVDVSKHGVIFAGAQKNQGPSGVTTVIVRDDLLGHARKITPTVFDYKITADNKSLYNTPPTQGLHVAGLVYEWVLQQGGVAEMERRAMRKSERLYKAIDSSRLFTAPVHPSARSRMNVVFRIKHENAAKLEDQFCQEAHTRGLEQLKGHRSVGGLRASLYNAVPEEAVEALVAFMREFEEKHLK